jgi:hypothetical protein
MTYYFSDSELQTWLNLFDSESLSVVYSGPEEKETLETAIVATPDPTHSDSELPTWLNLFDSESLSGVYSGPEEKETLETTIVATPDPTRSKKKGHVAARLSPHSKTLISLVSNVIFPMNFLSVLDVSVMVIVSKGCAKLLDAHKTISEYICHRVDISKPLKLTTLLKQRALDSIMYGFKSEENHRLKKFCTECLVSDNHKPSVKYHVTIGQGTLKCSLCDACATFRM